MCIYIVKKSFFYLCVNKIHDVKYLKKEKKKTTSFHLSRHSMWPIDQDILKLPKQRNVS